MPAISVSRPHVVADLHLEKPFLAHHVSHDLLEAAQRLAFKRPPRAQVSAVCPEPFAEFVPSGSRQVELFRANDLNACNDVMSLDGYAINATQLTILLATKHDRAGSRSMQADTPNTVVFVPVTFSSRQLTKA
jgi:hypothetical protein